MIVKQINQETVPEYFLMPIDTGETFTDDDGVERPIIIYEEAEDVTTAYPGNKALRRRCKKGIGNGSVDLVFKPESLDITSNGIVMARSRLIGEVWDVDQWKNSTFSFVDADIFKVGVKILRAKITKSVPIGNFVFGIEIEWSIERSRFTFYLKGRNKLVRLKWQVRIFDEFLNSKGEPSINFYPDYNNMVYGKQIGVGYIDHQWIFEPDGYQCPDTSLLEHDGLEV